MAMDPRNTKYSRSIFYRGISLKDYLRKSSVAHRNLEYPDDETILLDENQTPVFIDDAFIVTEPREPACLTARRQTTNISDNRLPVQKSNIELPTLRSKSKLKTHTKSYITERNSTDTSLGSSFDLKLSVLPEISQKESDCQESILNSNRGQRRSVSRQKMRAKVPVSLAEVEEEVVVEKEKPHITREYTEYIKKEMMLKHRYNVHGQVRVNGKPHLFNRVKSHEE